MAAELPSPPNPPDRAPHRAHASIEPLAVLADAYTAITSTRFFPDRTWQLDYISPGCVHVFGYTADEFQSNPSLWASRLPPGEYERAVATHVAAVAKGTPYSFVYRFRHRDGAMRWISQSCRSRPHPTEPCRIVTATSLDVTPWHAPLEQSVRAGERYRKMVETWLAGVWEIDTEGRTTFANPCMAAMLGTTVDAMRGTHITAWMTPEWRDRARDLMQRRRSGISEVHPFEFRRSDGTPLPALVATNPIMDDSGRFTGSLAMVSDISELSAAREREKHTIQRYESLLDTAEGVVWEADAHTFQFTYVSRRAERLFGYPCAQWLNSPSFWIDHLHPEDRASAVAACIRHTERLEPHEMEYRMIAADGREIWVRDIVSVHTRDGLPPLLRGVMVDVTSSKAEEHAFARTKLLLNTSQALARVGGWELDINRRSLFWTDHTRIIHELDPDDPVPTLDEAIEFYAPECRAAVASAVAHAVETGEPFEFEQQIITRRGRRIWVHATSAITQENGKTARITGAIQDITERKNAEIEQSRLRAELLHAQRLESIGRLAGGVAHDFNNLLVVILGYAELALTERVSDRVREHLEGVRTAAQSAAHLTRQLLTFAQRQPTQPQRLDLRAAIDARRASIRAIAGPDIDLVFDFGEQPAVVRIDPAQLDQILTNLIANSRDAIRATRRPGPPAGTIRVGLYAARQPDHPTPDHTTTPSATRPDSVELHVADDGCGIPDDALPHVREPFFTTKPLGQGTGLGCATVDAIVRHAGGTMNITSAVGKGTRVSIILPRLSDLALADLDHATPDAPADPTGGETILFIDDEPAVLALGRLLLQGLGYTVHAAASGEEALGIAADLGPTFDLIITDVRMPGLCGPDLARALARYAPQARVLFVSGYSGDLLDMPSSGPQVHFLPKPFTRSDLAHAVRATLANAPSTHA
jgi:PAS domain S-box-containing protein